MKPLNPTEKARGAANAMQAGADAVTPDGKLDRAKLRENLTQIVREGAKQIEAAQTSSQVDEKS